MNRLRQRVRGGERGAFLIIFALCLTVLILIIALVVDLAYTRSDRRNGQLGVDNAAASAAQTLAEGNAVTACLDAFAITASTLETSAFSGQNCAAAFASACVAGTPRSTSGTSGDYRLTVHYPVASGSALLANTSTISNAGIAPSADDGQPCERIGVELTTDGEPFFGKIAGATSRTSTVHAVGRIAQGQGVQRALNLLALERTDCQTIDVGGQGVVVVQSFVDQHGTRQAGIAAVDSNGTTACSGGKATLETSGQGVLRADGPCDAPNQATECQAKGKIDLFATVTNPGCSGTPEPAPACKESGGAISPNATQSPGRYTRAPVDYRYDCLSSYTGKPWYSDQDIPPCAAQTGNNDYISELQAHADVNSAPPGYAVVTDCNPNDVQTYVGNTYVACADYTPRKITTFLDGNVIFQGGVKVGNGEGVRFHQCAPACTATMTWSTGANYVETQSSSNHAWVYIRGAVEISNGATFTTNKAAVVTNSSGKFDSTGGTVELDAPTSGPFEDLALWSEGIDTHKLTGGGSLVIRGAFFAGRATLDYVGQGTQNLTTAQLIANKFNFSGQGQLSLRPAADKAVNFPANPTFGLIR